MSRVVAMGEILWDEFPGERRLGGAPANFAWHVHGLGMQAHMVSRVGDDAAGREIREVLTAMGMDTAGLSVDPMHPTGRVVVEVDAAGRPRYDIIEGVAWDYLEASADIVALARRADVFAFGSLAQRHGPSHTAIVQALRETSSSCRRVFDMNLRQHYYSPEILIESMELATIVKLNDEELPAITSLLDLRADRHPLQALRERFDVELVALTRGSRGSILAGEQGEDEHPGVSVSVADTVGAGDAFTAALCAGLERGWPLERTHDFANRLAAFVCSQPGGAPGVPEQFRRELGVSSVA